MAHRLCIWYDENIDHLAQHGIIPQDFEHVLFHPIVEGSSDSSGRPSVQGFTSNGRWLFCVYEEVDET